MNSITLVERRLEGQEHELNHTRERRLEGQEHKLNHTRERRLEG